MLLRRGGAPSFLGHYYNPSNIELEVKVAQSNLKVEVA
jgi:hypothetical protein